MPGMTTSTATFSFRPNSESNSVPTPGQSDHVSSSFGAYVKIGASLRRRYEDAGKEVDHLPGMAL